MGARPFLLLCSTLAGSASVGCSGRVGESLPEPTPVFAGTGTVSLPSWLGPAPAVPTGVATTGEHEVDASGDIVPVRCTTSGLGTGATGTSRVVVGAFRLTELEISNDAYARCVREGRCREPDPTLPSDPTPGPYTSAEKSHLPVGVDFLRARQFCKAYGGDLPTLGQIRRAMADSDPAYGVPSVSAALSACGKSGELSPTCNRVMKEGVYKIDRPGEVFRPLGPVGSHDWDIGPFGHRDLFGNAAEWVRGFPASCRVDDPILTEREAYGRTLDVETLPWIMMVQPAQGLLFRLPLPWPKIPSSWLIQQGPELSTGQSDYFTGFRCAFPPEAK